jgi:hypothetical protein
MTTISKARAPKHKKPIKVDLSKLNDQEINELPEEVFIASLSLWGRRFMAAALPLKGKLKEIK